MKLLLAVLASLFLGVSTAHASPVTDETLIKKHSGIATIYGTRHRMALDLQGDLDGEVSDKAKPALGFVRLKSNSRRNAPPVFFVPGGPGGKAIGLLDNAKFVRIFSGLLETRDVVIIDQRGSQSSSPRLACRGLSPGLDDPAPGKSRHASVWEALFLECYRRKRASDLDPGDFTVMSHVSDIERVRSHFKYDKLALFGLSFGTHLSLAYARRHPDRVEKIVLSGFEGPDHTIDLATGFDRVLQRLSDAYERAYGEKPSFRRELDEILKSFGDNREIETWVAGRRVEFKASRADLESYLWLRAGDIYFLARFPQMIDDFRDGDFSEVASWMHRLSKITNVRLLPVVTDCSSWLSADRRAAVTASLGASIFEAAPDAVLMRLCPDMGIAALPDAFRKPFRISAPMLIFAGDLDVRTPVENVVDWRENMEDAAVVHLSGVAHSWSYAYTHDRRVGRVLAHFLDHGTEGLAHRTSLVFPVPFKR